MYGGGSWVRDVGTEFSVYLRPADVRVTVNQGRVEVGSNDLPVMDPSLMISFGAVTYQCSLSMSRRTSGTVRQWSGGDQQPRQVKLAVTAKREGVIRQATSR